MFSNISCEKDSIMEGTVLLNEDEATTRSSFYCGGGSSCLPGIECYRSAGTITVTWYSESGNDHPIALTCTSSGSYYSNSISPSGGSWEIPVQNDYDKPYELRYSLHCGTCKDCNRSATIKLYPDGQILTGSGTECFKNYVTYATEGITQNTIKLRLSINAPVEEQLKKPDKYMEIDSGRAYRITRQGEKSCAILFTKKSSNYIEISLPFNPDCAYRVELFSSKCTYNKEHYLEIRCSTDSFHFYWCSDPSEIKAHSK